MNSNRKKTNKKYNFKRIVITLAVIIVIITAVVIVICLTSRKKGNNTDNTSLGETVNINELMSEGEYLEITLGDCSLYVGASLQLECTANPENLAQNVVWSSGDSEIVSVTEQGVITILKEGTTAITAVNGVYSDSIIINAIAENTTVGDSVTGLPIYDVVDGSAVAVEVTPSSDSNPDSDVDVPEESSAYEEETDSSVQSTAEADRSTEGDTQSATDLLIDKALEIGFNTYLDGVYLYEEDGNYLGELIIGSEYTQIYVMTRTTAFDSSLKQLLASVLPEGYESIFASFVAATRDQTLSSDGHRIRIVASVNGGHSQIIIY